MKRAVLYMRVSSLDQHPESQLLDLRQMAAPRDYAIRGRLRRSMELRLSCRI